MSSENKIMKALTSASEKYAEQTALRATIQVIPYVGGALDTLFSGRGSHVQQARVLSFLGELDKRMKMLEAGNTVEPTEELLDVIVSILDGVSRTRSEEKKEQFANIIANKIEHDAPWEEAETAVRLLKDLDQIHIKVLIATVEAPVCGSPFDTLSVVTTHETPAGKEGVVKPLSLLDLFPQYSKSALRMICSELVSKGLLYDEGVGRLDTKAMQYFIASDLAKWLLGWIQAKAE